jgi:phosphoribosylformylglycinamidine cyclo-ligase
MVKTYAESGVSQDEKSAHIAALVRELTYRRRGIGRPLTAIGHFTGLVDIGPYALSLCTDGVGTKLIVANEMRKWDTVGIDCVAMNVNDMICIGAEPIAFVDYFAIEGYDHEVARQIGVGLNRGASMANVSIVGGEVAVLPEIVRGFDLAGTCFGIVKKKDVVLGRAVRVGDVVIGLPSSGIHSNGLTLARRLLRDADLTVFDRIGGTGEPWGPTLLEPTLIYVKPVLRALKKAKVHGLAHVTGGALRNLARLKADVEFAVTDPLPPQLLFRELQALGDIEASEMYQTFNMGMGFVIVAPEAEAKNVLRALRPEVQGKIVGEVRKGRGVSVPSLGLHWDTY